MIVYDFAQIALEQARLFNSGDLDHKKEDDEIEEVATARDHQLIEFTAEDIANLQAA